MSSPLGENQLIGASGNQAKDYEIEYSCRFDETTSTALTRTPTSNGNSQVATFSAWMKYDVTFCNFWDVGVAGGGSTQDSFQFGFNSNGACFTSEQNNNSVRYDGTTTALYRDPAAWYHVHFIINTPHATASERIKIYVNGVYQSGTYNYPSQNASLNMNLTSHGMRLGAGTRTGGALYNEYSGLIAEAHWLDGQAIGPENFGETDAAYGHWKPIEYEGGNYGTNGFYLKFADSSALGTDSSGTGNNLTLSNLAATDQMIDTPTNNFCTLDPIQNQQAVRLAEGNLRSEGTHSFDWDDIQSTFAVSSGKWYWEVRCLNIADYSAQSWIAGIRQTGFTAKNLHWYSSSYTAASHGIVFGVQDGNYKITNTSQSSFTHDIAEGDIVQFRLDLDNNELSISVDGSDKGKVFDITANTEYTPAANLYDDSSMIANFGQDSSFAGTETAQGNTDGNGKGDFYYTPPSGFLALCTNNLPAPTVKPKDNFNVILYAGNTSVDRDITGVGFQPDFTWIKQRTDNATENLWLDRVRGAGELIRSNADNAEVTANSILSAFLPDGFTLGDGSNQDPASNASGKNYVAWNWKASGSGSSNTNGTINTTSTSANTSAGFSIVTYTGDGNANATIGHGLSKAPELVIIKNRGTTDDWNVFFSQLSSNTYATATTFNIGDKDTGVMRLDVQGVSGSYTMNAQTNTNSHTYVAYCFHSVEGYSKIGQYTGNGAPAQTPGAGMDGPFIHTGFQPEWVLIKRTTGDSWNINDDARSPDNPVRELLLPDLVGQEYSDVDSDFLSNGFKIRHHDGMKNYNNVSHVYFAIAEFPFKFANAR